MTKWGMGKDSLNNNGNGGSTVLLPAKRLTVRMDRNKMASFMFRIMKKMLGEDRAKWEPWMWQVADWLVDNRGRNLLLYGQPGTGKTYMALVVIKNILEHEHCITLNLVTRDMLNDMSKPFEHWTHKILDDVGHESTLNKFGDHYRFDRIIEEASRNSSQLLIVTTNLYPVNLFNHYGTRTYDRLRDFVGIRCDGKSKRGSRKVPKTD